MKTNNTHKFGGDWTSLKLKALEGYLTAYSTALSKQTWCNRVYIDAFSGTGQCEITSASGQIQIDGSAKIALDTKPNFHSLYFIDKKMKHTKALQQLCNNYPEQNTKVIYEDANIAIPQILNAIKSNERGVIFIDPYGMNFNWDTLSKVAKSNFDVWYLFPLSGFFRNATVVEASLEQEKDDAITRLLGDKDWKEAIYKPPPTLDLFGDNSRERGDWKDLSNYATQRLKTIFPLVLEPRIIYNDREIPKFALYFAMSNENKKAQALAKKIADYILDTG
jgi:three-Cys-motif partner protein